MELELKCVLLCWTPDIVGKVDWFDLSLMNEARGSSNIYS